MKLLFCDNTLWGLLNFRGGVIRHFLAQGHQVVLVAPADALSDSSVIPSGVRFIPVELDRTGMNPWRDWNYYRTLKKIYRIESPDYVFHYTIKPNVYGTWAAHSLGLRSSAMIAGLGHVYSSGGPGSAVARLMYKCALRYSERVLVLNRANYDVLRSRGVVAESKLLFLPGGEGVNLSQFQYMALPRNPRPVFLMICRLLYEKGYAEFCAAAQALYGLAEFRVMGPLDTHPTAVPREVVEEDVRRGWIQYVGYSSDVGTEIVKADCLVLPSAYGEGLSRVLMEGLAMGRPIIASDIPGCRETVMPGKNGFLCRPSDSESLIRAMQSFMSLSVAEREEAGRVSRGLAERVFDERLVIEQYDAIVKA